MRDAIDEQSTRKVVQCDSTLSVMTRGGQASGSGVDSGRDNRSHWDAALQIWRTWQDAIGWRLTKSATIALLLSPIGLLAISLARLLIVSDYNTVTASAVVSSGGYVDALLGTIIPVVPLVLPYLALGLLFFNRVALALLAVLATALVSPATVSRSEVGNLARKDWDYILGASFAVVIIMAVLAVLVILLMLAAMPEWGFSSFAKTAATIACIALIPFVSQSYPFPAGRSSYADLIRRPWLPAEMITLTSGQIIVGYVLADSGSFITVLMNDNRSVYYYPDSAVAGRQVCEIGQAEQGQPLIGLLPAGTRPSAIPQCRSASGYSTSASGSSQGRAVTSADHDMLPIRSSAASRRQAHD
jgi:hypothetical protein